MRQIDKKYRQGLLIYTIYPRC